LNGLTISPFPTAVAPEVPSQRTLLLWGPSTIPVCL
jgi:hypothetical protein